jgi:hypothetical protein
MKETMLYCKRNNEYYPVIEESEIEASIAIWVKMINSANPMKRVNKRDFVVVDE